MMRRRELLKALAAVPLVMGVPSLAWSAGAERRILFGGVSPEYPPAAITTLGAWPEDLTGTLYRNGPALFERNGYRHPHWFDGDGMVHRFHLSGSGISHSSRYVRTSKFVAEERAARFLSEGVTSEVPNGLPLAHNDAANTANISVRKIGDKLFALWESGSAYELDPDSLKTLGVNVLNDDLKHAPFSAHPLMDSNGSWWNIGSWVFGDNGALLVYHLNAQGELKRYKLLQLAQKGYVHAFAISPQYLVVLNSACLYTPSTGFVEGFDFDSTGKSQIVLIDKNTLDIARVVDIPANFAFHFSIAREEKGFLTVSMAEYTNADIMLKGMRHGSPSFGRDSYPSLLVTYRINLATGAWQKESAGVDMEFPQYRLEDPYSHQLLYGIGRTNGVYPGFSNSLVAVDSRSGEARHYFYNGHTAAEEPLIVRSRSHKEYVIQPWLDLKAMRSGLSLFRAHSVAEGPIASAVLDYPLPLGFHGCFV